MFILFLNIHNATIATNLNKDVMNHKSPRIKSKYRTNTNVIYSVIFITRRASSVFCILVQLSGVVLIGKEKNPKQEDARLVLSLISDVLKTWWRQPKPGPPPQQCSPYPHQWRHPDIIMLMLASHWSGNFRLGLLIGLFLSHFVSFKGWNGNAR